MPNYLTGSFYLDGNQIDASQASQTLVVTGLNAGDSWPGVGSNTVKLRYGTIIGADFTFDEPDVEADYTMVVDVDENELILGGVDLSDQLEGFNTAAATVTATLGGTTAGQVTGTATWAGAPSGVSLKITYIYEVTLPGASTFTTYTQHEYPGAGASGSASNVLTGLTSNSSVKLTVHVDPVGGGNANPIATSTKVIGTVP